MAESRVWSAGLEWVQIALLDSAAYATGQLGASWAVGGGSPSFVLPGRRNATFTYKEGSETDIEEGNETVGVWRWGASYLATVEIELSDDDPDLDALIGATNVTSTPSSYYKMWTDEESMPFRPVCCAIITQLAQDADGIDGTQLYKNHFLLQAVAEVKDSGAAYQDKNNRTLRLTTKTVTRTPLGMSIATMVMGVNRGRIAALKFKSNYLVGLYSFKKDGIATGATLPYKPKSAVATAASGPNLALTNGAVTDLTSITPATGVIAFPAGASGDKLELLYEHEAVPTS